MVLICSLKELSPATLRNPSDCSVLTHSDNTVYAVRYAHPNCALGTTSHTPIPLYEIVEEEVRLKSVYREIDGKRRV